LKCFKREEEREKIVNQGHTPKRAETKDPRLGKRIGVTRKNAGRGREVFMNNVST